MLSFGRGDYRQLHLRDREGVEYAYTSLSDAKRLELLRHPPASDNHYLISALLLKAAIEFKQIRHGEIKQALRRLDLILEMEEIVVPHAFVDDALYYDLELHGIAQIGTSYKLVNTRGERIGYILMAQESKDSPILTPTLITIHPLVLSSHVHLPNLKVYSLAHVHLASNFTVDNLMLIHAERLSIDSNQPLTLRTNHFIANTEQSCLLTGKITCDSYRITAGDYEGHAYIEGTRGEIVAETTHFAERHFAKDVQHCAALTVHIDAQSHLHSPGSISFLTESLKIDGKITTNRLALLHTGAEFNGKIVSAKETIIQSFATSIITEQAEFIFSGNVKHLGNLGLINRGKIFYSPHVKVEWKKFTNPYLEDSLTYQPRKKDDVSVVPYTEADIPFYSVYLIDENKVDKPDTIPTLQFSGNVLLDFAGFSAIDGAVTLLSGENIQFSGSLWQRSYTEEYGIYFKGATIVLNGEVITNSLLNIQAESSINQNGYTRSQQLAIQTRAHEILPEADISAHQASIYASKRVRFEKSSHVKILDQLHIKTARMRNNTEVSTKTLLIEADRYILNRGLFLGGKQLFVTPVFASLGKLRAESVSITSYITFMPGINKIGSVHNNSLLSFTPCLLFTSYQWPSRGMLASSLMNICFVALNVCMPGSVSITLPIQIAVNALLRAASTANSIKQAYQQTTHFIQTPTSTNLVKTITTANQLALSITYAVISGITSVNAFSASANTTMSIGESLSDSLLAIGARSAPYVLSAFGSGANYSIVNIDPSIYFGSQANYNLLNVHAGTLLGLTQVTNSIYQVNASFSITLGPASSTSYRQYEFGDELSLLGQYSVSTNHLFVYSWLPVDHHHWAVQSNDITLKGFGNFDNSMMNGVTLDVEGKIVFANSRIKFTTIADRDKLQVITTHVDAHEIQVAESATYIEDAATVTSEHMHVAKEANVYDRASQDTIKVIENDGSVDLDTSQLSGDEFANRGKVHAENSLVNEHKLSGNWGKNASVAKNSHVYTDQGTRANDFYAHQGVATQEQIKDFFASVPELKAHYSGGMLTYQTTSELDFTNKKIVSLVPMTYKAKTFHTSGDFVTSVGVNFFATEDLTLNNTNFSLGGKSHFESQKNLNMDGSHVKCAGKFTTYAGQETHLKAFSIIAKEVSICGYGDVFADAQVKVTRHESKHWRWHGLHSGIEKKIDITTTVTPSEITATNGPVTITSEHGSITTHGVNFLGSSIHFNAFNSVLLYDLKGQNIHITKEYTLTGYSSEKEVTATATPSALLTDDKVYIDAKHGDVIGESTYIHAPKGIYIHAAHLVKFARPILYNSYQAYSFGLLNVNFPLQNFAGQPLSFSPLYQAGDSPSNVDKVAVLLNKADLLLAEIKGDASPLQTTIDTVFSPHLLSHLFSVDFTVGYHKTTIGYETLGPGGLETNNLHVQAGDKIEIANAYGVEAKHADLRAPEVDISGATLHTNQHDEGIALTVNVGLSGLTDMSAALLHSEASTTTQVINKPQVSDLHIETEHLRLHNTDLEVQKVTGHIGKITIDTSQEINESDSTTLQVTSESFGYQQEASHHEKFSHQSAFTAKDASDLRVNSIIQKDATVGDTIVAPRETQQSTLTNHDEKISVSGDLIRPFQNTKNLLQFLKIDQSETTNGKHHESHLRLPEIHRIEFQSPIEPTPPTFFIPSSELVIVEEKKPEESKAPTHPAKRHINPYAITANDIMPTKDLYQEIDSMLWKPDFSEEAEAENEPHPAPPPASHPTKVQDQDERYVTIDWLPSYYVSQAPQSAQPYDPYHLKIRALGLLQGLGGAAESSAGAALDVTTWETGIGAALGTTMIMSGMDNFATGMRQLITGVDEKTQIVQALGEVGVKNNVATQCQLAFDIVAPGAALTRAARTLVTDAPLALERLGLFSESQAPKLSQSQLDSFTYMEFKEVKPGIYYQAQRFGQEQLGEFFSPNKPFNSQDAEELFNIKKWSNNAEQYVTVEIKEGLSAYQGPVKNGAGTQIYIPNRLHNEFINQLDEQKLFIEWRKLTP